MISGPIVPTNRDGLIELLASDPESVETGLRVAATRLVLDDGLGVDALARDAVGRPVALVVAGNGADTDELTVKVLSLHRWFERHARFLTGAIPGVAFRPSAGIRLLVVGANIDRGLVAALSGLAVADVQVFEVETFRLENRTRFGVRDLTGAEDEHDTFDLPAAITDPRQREVGARFLDLLRRLDPRLEIRGDRFGRRFFVAGHPLIDILVDGGDLAVRVPGDVARPLADGGHVAAWFDRAARRYLDLVRDPSVGASETETSDLPVERTPGRRPSEHRVESAVLEAEITAEPVGRGEDSIVRSVEPRRDDHPPTSIRGHSSRGASIQTQLSADEFNALQHISYQREASGRGGMR